MELGLYDASQENQRSKRSEGNRRRNRGNHSRSNNQLAIIILKQIRILIRNNKIRINLLQIKVSIQYSTRLKGEIITHLEVI